jgi:hypothetical protein
MENRWYKLQEKSGETNVKPGPVSQIQAVGKVGGTLVEMVGAGTARSGSAHCSLQFFKYIELPAISCFTSVPGPGPHILRVAGKI